MKFIQKLEDVIIAICKAIILFTRYFKRNILRIACYVMTIAIILAGYYYGLSYIESYFGEESTVQATAQFNADTLLKAALNAKEEKRIETERIEAERIEAERKEAERIEAERKEAERIEAERKEAERIEAQRKKAERIEAERKKAERIAAEKEKQRLREEAAKADALRKEVIAAEKAKAAAEKTERARIAKTIKAQHDFALAEQAAYDLIAPEPIVKHEVTNIMQKPELPNGCEITALAILLNYKGYFVQKGVLSDNYLKKMPFYAVGEKDERAGGDPNYYFAGDPRKNSNAYYCFAGPIVDAASKFLTQQGGAHTATDITGTDESGLIAQLDEGNPVIAWGTLAMGDALTFAPSAWIINDKGDKHIPFLNLHCVVINGYDETFFYLCDPLRGNVAIRRSTFMKAYKQIGSRAVIIS